MTPNNKDTIYVDVDEEITGIIDKVRGSSGKIVALVLPKRASVLQSIVNMKLLKRSADEAKKRLVLITSEAGLLPLAGAVGLYVAKTAQSKPEIPSAPLAGVSDDETIDATDPEDFSAVAAASKPIGELAGLGTATPLDGDELETLHLDEEEDAALAASTAVVPPAAVAKAIKPKKNAKLAVPNFERFRLLLVAAVILIIAIIGGLFYAITVLPKAEIAITTNASAVNVGLDLNLSTGAKIVDLASSTLPAKLDQQQKSFTQQSPATGQKNNGDRAAGNVTVSTTCTKKPSPVAAGVGISAGNLTFITTSQLTYDSININDNGDFVCTGSVDVKAQQGGAQYNLPAKTQFSVAGNPGATATNKADFTGGTDNNVKVVSQADIDAAKQKIATSDATVKQDLRKQLEQEGYYALTATYVAAAPTVTTSAEAGAVADNVTVTETINYSMYGVKRDDLKSIVDSNVKTQIDTSKQTILSEGLSEATFKVVTSNDTAATVTFQTVATAGPDLRVDALKGQVAGKKGGDIKSLLQSNPGVTDVQTHLSPFFVTSVPTNPAKITITVAKPTAAVQNHAAKP